MNITKTPIFDNLAYYINMFLFENSKCKANSTERNGNRIGHGM